MKSILVKNPAGALRSVWLLYGAAFTMSIAISVWWTAMPFVVRNIGGTEGHVGYAWAANMLGYMVCLLLAGIALGQHNPRNTTRIAAGIIFASAVAMVIVVYAILTKDMVGNIALVWVIIAVGTLAGAAMSLYWPFLMSWVSEDLEGADLNRRLGAYNCTWSSAAILGPLLAGVLVKTGTPLPVIFAAVSLIFCFLFINLAADGSLHTTLFGDEANRPAAGGDDRDALMRFRWMARIALFSACVSTGVLRSQFALLFTNIGFSEVWFGILCTMFGICQFAVLTAAGKFIFWHFKSALLLGAQALLLASLLLIIYGRTLPLFSLLFIIMGCAFGFAYSSHLYYGTCGAKKRSIQMVIHEATISVGIIVGSGMGGYLAKNVGLYQPYWFSLALVAAGFLTQIILLLTRAAQITRLSIVSRNPGP